MSFKCQKCNKAQPNRSCPVNVVTETRYKEYFNNKDEQIGYGSEIVKEIKICNDCYNLVQVE